MNLSNREKKVERKIMVGETGFEPATPCTQNKVRYQAAPLTDRDIFLISFIKLENMVRKERLELSRREALEPKSSVSTNSTTSAKSGVDDGT